MTIRKTPVMMESREATDPVSIRRMQPKKQYMYVMNDERIQDAPLGRP
jgi:hypothetical protein